MLLMFMFTVERGPNWIQELLSVFSWVILQLKKVLSVFIHQSRKNKSQWMSMFLKTFPSFLKQLFRGEFRS